MRRRWRRHEDRPAPIRRDSAAARARPGSQHHDALMRDPVTRGVEENARSAADMVGNLVNENGHLKPR